MSCFVLSFPYSSIGIARVFPGENAECVCRGLRDIFEHIGGAPARTVFDDAAGVGRRACEKIRATGLFSAFAAHHGFVFPFCNVDAGHEKGSVEAKVRCLRSNLFVPVPRVSDMGAYNGEAAGHVHVARKGAPRQGQAGGPAVRGGQARDGGAAREALRLRALRMSQGG